jgi:hypothetical protein
MSIVNIGLRFSSLIFKIILIYISHTVLRWIEVASLTLPRTSSVAHTALRRRFVAGLCGEATLGPSQSMHLPETTHFHFASLTSSPGRQLPEHHAMAVSAPRDSSGGRQLPTRVSTACDRCRRNKSRCDPFRPCSLCIRANVECIASNNEGQSRLAKRRRTREPLRDEHLNSEPPTVSRPHAQPAPAPGHTRTEPDLLSASESHQDLESRRPSVGEGPVDSAVGIAHKVSLRFYAL